MLPYLIFKLFFWVGATTVCGEHVIPTFSDEHDARHKGKQLRNIRFEEYTQLGTSLLEGTHKISVPFTTLKVLDFNVLSQTHLLDHRNRYRVNDPKSLLWEVRSENMLKEIRNSYADVLCLQEIEKNHIAGFYRTFEKMGYTGFYSHRGGGKPDGCGIFYKTKQFNLSDISIINYFKGKGTLLDRHNSAVVLKLELKRYPGNYIVVVTTHLLYNQNRQDVKLGQMQILLAEIDRIAYKGNNMYYPVILTGDFNIPPDSGIIKLIKSQELQYSGLSGRTLNSVRNPGFGIYLSSQLLPPWLGVEDTCQYTNVLEAREKGLPDPRKIKNMEEYALIFDVQNVDNMTVLPPEEDMDFSLNTTENANKTAGSFKLWEACKHWLTFRMYPNVSRLKSEGTMNNVTKRNKLFRNEFRMVSGEESTKFNIWMAIKKWFRFELFPRINNSNKYPFKSNFGSVYVSQTAKSGKRSSRKKRYGTGTLTHEFHFSSAYDHPDLDKLECSFKQNDRFKQKMFTYDYIFFTEGARSSESEFKAGDLHLLSRLRMPTVDEFHRFLHPIPNCILGSDHLSLTATFLLCLDHRIKLDGDISGDYTTQ